MSFVILPETPISKNFSSASERVADMARTQDVIRTLDKQFGDLNKTMKVFAKHAEEGGDFSEESKLLHIFVNKMGAVRGSISLGFINAAYLYCVENAQLYAGKEGIETRHSDAFNKMALPLLPSALFADLRDALEPHTIKTPVNHPS